jgi:hypothetical protein
MNSHPRANDLQQASAGLHHAVHHMHAALRQRPGVSLPRCAPTQLSLSLYTATATCHLRSRCLLPLLLHCPQSLLHCRPPAAGHSPWPDGPRATPGWVWLACPPGGAQGPPGGRAGPGWSSPAAQGPEARGCQGGAVGWLLPARSISVPGNGLQHAYMPHDAQFDSRWRCPMPCLDASERQPRTSCTVCAGSTLRQHTQAAHSGRALRQHSHMGCAYCSTYAHATIRCTHSPGPAPTCQAQAARAKAALPLLTCRCGLIQM